MDREKRAAPRKAKKDPLEAPLFLQKTFQMVDTCSPDVVGWSTAGDTFIVKVLDQFCELLPQFFKHRNFRSFVRQLNFYGFRKLRADPTNPHRPSGWWEFKHEKFLKGHPEMLPLIKRAEHYEEEAGAPSEAREIEVVGKTKCKSSNGAPAELLVEVKTLREKVSTMNSTIEQLTSLVDSLLLERAGGTELALPLGVQSAADALSKKRKVVTLGDGTLDLTQPFDSAPIIEQVDSEDLSHTSLETVSSEDSRMHLTNFDFSNLVEDVAFQPPPLSRCTSSASVTSLSCGGGGDNLTPNIIANWLSQVNLERIPSSGGLSGTEAADVTADVTDSKPREPFLASRLDGQSSGIPCHA